MRFAAGCGLAVMTFRTAQPQCNFFSQFMPKPPDTPANVYSPDPSAELPGLPTSFQAIYAAAATGVRAAIGDGVSACEVDFPPIANVNRLSDGSAKSEALVHAANAEAAQKIQEALSDLPVALIGCSGGARAALRDVCDGANVYSLRDGAKVSADSVAICVQPTADEQWLAAEALQCRCVVVLNGLLGQGALPHAYYYKCGHGLPTCAP